MANCLLHVGYMKTGTTFLQDEIFNNSSIGFAIPYNGKGRALLVEKVILSDGYSYDPERVSKCLEEASRPVFENGLIPVWSDETLVGEPVSRRYDGHSNALRLRSVLPDAKVLITIREQINVAYSMYAEYIRQGGTASLTQFIGNGDEQMSFSPILRQDYLFFDRTVQFYQELFGKNNVLVLPQELLVENIESYLGHIGDFLDITLNLQNMHNVRKQVSFSAMANSMALFLNHFRSPHPLTNKLPMTDKYILRVLKIITRMTPKPIDRIFRERIRNRLNKRYHGVFIESNKHLAYLIDTDLSKYGYY